MKTLQFFHPTNPSSPVFPFLLTVPDDRQPGEKLPLILFLHGAGERGVDGHAIHVHGIPKYFSRHSSYGGLRVITLSPQCPPEMTWNHYLFELKELVDTVVREQGADPDAVSITGISMGGFGTWEMLCTYPDTFSAGAPICGGGMGWRACFSTPVRAFHGDADDDVLPAYSIIMCDALNAHGGHADLTLYHQCGHNCWERAYEQSNVIAWLASQRRCRP